MFSFTLFGTPIKAKPVVLLIVVVLWSGVTALQVYWHPGCGLWQGLLIGFATTVLLIVVDFGHALAHSFSARYAGAPMDEILLTADMPRTIYWNNDVAPAVHRMRALGGPIFNLMGLLVSATSYGFLAGHPIARELAAWSAVGHGLLLVMSLAPLPPVDGGTILKWTLVAWGKTVDDADEIVRRMDWGIGIVAGIAGIAFLGLQTWLAGTALVVVATVVIGIAAGKLK